MSNGLRCSFLFSVLPIRNHASVSELDIAQSSLEKDRRVWNGKRDTELYASPERKEQS